MRPGNRGLQECLLIVIGRAFQLLNAAEVHRSHKCCARSWLLTADLRARHAVRPC